MGTDPLGTVQVLDHPGVRVPWVQQPLGSAYPASAPEIPPAAARDAEMTTGNGPTVV